MWILPKNYQLSSAFAADMVASKEDLTLPGLNIESSLMWRSKPSPLRTWLARWKKGSYLPHLYTRILKPSHRKYFEEKLASSRAGIHVNLSQQQDNERVQKTLDICGHLSDKTSKQFDLLESSLKTSKDTSRLDSQASSAIWKKMVTDQRGEYSQRVKLALHIKESGCTSWPTPTVQDGSKATKKMQDNHQNNLTAVVFSQEVLPTPTARDWKGGYTESSLTRSDGRSRRFDRLPNAAIGGVGTDIVSGHLNPDWVEWLMGVPTGWTGLGSWETQ